MPAMNGWRGSDAGKAAMPLRDFGKAGLGTPLEAGTMGETVGIVVFILVVFWIVASVLPAFHPVCRRLQTFWGAVTSKPFAKDYRESREREGECDWSDGRWPREKWQDDRMERKQWTAGIANWKPEEWAAGSPSPGGNSCAQKPPFFRSLAVSMLKNFDPPNHPPFPS